VLLTLDGTDDPTHGAQAGTAHHGSFRQDMYHPLLVSDGDTDRLDTAVLRPGNAHGEAAGITYTVGLLPNPKLEAVAAPLLAAAQAQQAVTGAKVRLAGETTYQAGRWPRPRRVVSEAEALVESPDTRFVVAARPDAPLARYDFSVDGGEPELRIKDRKRACCADRPSDHRFVAHQFRLFLPAAAHWLLDILHLRLLKIGGRARELLTRVRLHLASSHPGQPLWALLAARSGRP
jgi:Transposase DDE domain group 1